MVECLSRGVIVVLAVADASAFTEISHNDLAPPAMVEFRFFRDPPDVRIPLFKGDRGMESSARREIIRS